MCVIYDAIVALREPVTYSRLFQTPPLAPLQTLRDDINYKTITRHFIKTFYRLFFILFSISLCYYCEYNCLHNLLIKFKINLVIVLQALIEYLFKMSFDENNSNRVFNFTFIIVFELLQLDNIN